MKNILLKSEETVSGMKGFIVLGTTYVYGEDLPCKGRVSQCEAILSNSYCKHKINRDNEDKRFMW